RESAEHAGAPDGDRERAGAVLGRGPEGVQIAPRAGGRRAGLRSGPAALPDRAAARQTRARLRDPDARGPRARGAGALARPAGVLAGGRRTGDAPVQPPLELVAGDPLGVEAGVAAARRPRRPALRPRAGRTPVDGLRRRRLRRALADRLDLVRAGRGGRRPRVRRVARRPRTDAAAPR